MTTVNRTIECDDDKVMALRLVEARGIPFTLSLTDGKHRSTAQNKLQRLWMTEISQQLGDQSPEEVRGYCKLTIGVPILKTENEAFAKEYDEVVKPLPYPLKLRLMMTPFDFGVTRLMTTKQKSTYLDGIIRHFGEQGVVLTMPEEMRHPNNESPDAAPSPGPSGSDDAVSTPEASSSKPAGEDPHSAPAGSLSPEAWLLNVARMLWAATSPNGDIEVLRNQKKSAVIAFPKPADCPDRISGKADSVFNQCREVINTSLEQADGLALIAGIVGVDQDEILERAK